VPEENENIPVEETKKPPKTKTPAVVAEAKVVGIYATEYFRSNKIPYCEKCGAQYQTDTNNNPVCAESFPVNICPRLGN
jgi:hypothetical protein